MLTNLCIEPEMGFIHTVQTLKRTLRLIVVSAFVIIEIISKNQNKLEISISNALK